MVPEKIFKSWFKPTPSFPLEAFRFLLGIAYLVFFVRWYLSGRFEALYIKPEFHFRYDWFFPLPELSEAQSYFLLILLVLASIAIILRWRVRWAGLTILLGFGYFFFLEKGMYNNHYYFMLLLAAWLMVVFDGKPSKFPIQAELIPQWKLWVFRVQIIIVYFFGGIAKFNSEWLSGNTTSRLLMVRFDLTEEQYLSLISQMLTWGGIGFDLFIGFLLLWKPTRWVGFALAIAFNLTNHFVFNIGVFPWMMMASLLLFLDESPFKVWKAQGWGQLKFESKPLVVYFLSIILLVQVVLPFRHLLYPGKVVWTEEGYFFSWRMISSVKKTNAKFRVSGRGLSKPVIVEPKKVLTRMQNHALGRYPELALQYAHHLKEEYRKKGIRDIRVEAKVQVKMNNRPYQFVFDPLLDLASVPIRPLKSNRHIKPLEE